MDGLYILERAFVKVDESTTAATFCSAKQSVEVGMSKDEAYNL
jgi:hypothetical protein